MSAKSILVVEDSATELLALTRALESRGYQYTVATDGEEAIQKAIKQKPTLVLLDVVLPKKNGFQVCRQLKNTPETKEIKVIVISGKSQESDRYWGLKQGADEYLVKPVRTDDLLGTIARYM
jgi:twitching motility two-component system response regulator PilH